MAAVAAPTAAGQAAFTASQWKDQGNEHYRAKRYTDAVLAYSNSLRQTTAADRDIRQIVLLNRSKAYTQLQQSHLAYADVKVAVGVQAFTRPRDWKTLAECAERLGWLDEAARAYWNLGICHMKQTPPNPREAQGAQTAARSRVIELYNAAGEKKKKGPSKTASDSLHDLMDAVLASEYERPEDKEYAYLPSPAVRATPTETRDVRVAVSTLHGSGVIAKRAFAKGEVILYVEPSALVHWIDGRCLACCQVIPQARRSLHLDRMEHAGPSFYCKDACYRERKFTPRLSDPSATMRQLCQMLTDEKHGSRAFDSLNLTAHLAYSSLVNERCVKGVLFDPLWDQYVDLTESLKLDRASGRCDFASFEQMLLKVQANAVPFHDDQSTLKAVAVFGGFQPFVNHACIPNARWDTNLPKRGATMHLVALAPIAQGEEITISYGPTVQNEADASKRSRALLQRGFVPDSKKPSCCRCTACSGETK
jgi:hypothetical protein